MAKVNFLAQIRKQMEKLQAEYAALSEAYKIISQSQGGRGRKPKFDILAALGAGGGNTKLKRKGKRGRPPGAKNKPVYKKPGPKSQAGEAKTETRAAKKRATRKRASKRVAKKAVSNS